MSDNEMNNEVPQEFEEEAIEIEEEGVFEDEDDDDEDLFEDDAEPIVDPTRTITLRTSGGQTRYIPTDEPVTLAQAKALSGLTFGAVTFYMNAAVIDDTTVLPVGSTVVAVGNVKGGC